jgi:rSAM/selenodomain-associated transferase 1
MSIEFFRSFETMLQETDDMHLIIFIKNPVLGKVKTRLAAGIGDHRALEVYMQLLEITRGVALKVNCTRNVFYSDEIVSDDWEDDKFNKFVQEGEDLGERMKNAFEQVFALGANKAVIIGSDCPELTSNIIAEAFELLDSRDVTIGPANDGGYYLLGMKKLHPFLFEGKEWSTDSVLSATEADLIKNGLSLKKLQALSDLDTTDELGLLK